MRYYRYLVPVLLLGTMLLVVSGCSEEASDPGRGGAPYVRLEGEFAPCPAGGGEVVVLFSTNRSWRITSEVPQGAADNWYTITPRVGKAGEQRTVTVRMEPNPDYAPRRVVVVLHAERIEKRIELTQSRRNAILTGDNRRDIGSQKQRLIVEVRSDREYSVTVKEGSEWIREASEPSGAGAQKGTHGGTAAHPQAETGAAGWIREVSEPSGAGMPKGTHGGTAASPQAETGAAAGWIRDASEPYGAGAQKGTHGGTAAHPQAEAGAAGAAARAGAAAGWIRDASEPSGAGAQKGTHGGTAAHPQAETGAAAGWIGERSGLREGTDRGATGADPQAEAGAAAGWIRDASEPSSGAAPVGTHLFEIAANPEAEARTGVIVFRETASGLEDELTVVQAAWEDEDPERTALRALYEAAGGEGWTRSDNWCSERPLEEWYGVQTDAEGHVTALRLPKNNLRGTIPRRIGGLTHLRRLELPHNALEGELNYYDKPTGWHSVFEKLTAMETIDLSHNALTGNMFLSLLERLQRVDLSSNHLTGTPIPIQWAPLYDNGRYIDVIVNNNHMTGGMQDFIVNHPQWSRIALQFIRQTVMIQGTTLTGGLIYDKQIILPDFTFTDLRDGAQHSMQELYGQNKLTMLLQWDPTQEDSQTFAQTVVRRLHTLYGAQGFAVVAFAPEGAASRKAVEEYLRTHEVPWPVVAEYADAEGRRVILPAEPYPGLLLVDQEGKVVEHLYNGMRASGAFWEDYDPYIPTDLVARSFEISNEFNYRFRNTFGNSEYVSTDYSKDKQCVTLQEATRGRGIDLVLIGDAFTDIDIETGFYRQVMEQAMEAFFELEPTKSYREYFNVRMVNAVSRNAYIGEDRNMSALRTITRPENERNNIDPSFSSIDGYLRICPLPAHPYRFPAIIINGYPTGITYINLDSQSYAFQSYLPNNLVRTTRTFQHETIGHLLAYLDDEYNEAGKDLIPEAEKQKLRLLQERGYNLNVSLTSDPKAVPWAHLIGDSRFPRAGIHEGGHYYAKGVWRSEFSSIMESSYSEGYFNAISRQLIVQQILELSGEGYTFEKFLEKDKDDYPTRSSEARSDRDHPPFKHFPPVIHYCK